MTNGQELPAKYKPHQKAHDIELCVHFVETDTISRQEIDLVMSVIDEIMCEIRRLEIPKFSASNDVDVTFTTDEYHSFCSSNPQMRTAT